MKNEVLYLLLNNYADHEAVFLASAIACDERSIKENPKYTNMHLQIPASSSLPLFH